MPPRLSRPVPRKDLLRLLRRHGWRPLRQRNGNHVVWEAPSGDRVVLPGGSRGNKPVGSPYLREINHAHGYHTADSRARAG